ncbi:Aspartate aminotransferase [Mycena sanguinolenta]|uniref:Aspartate aminotransferase n=1 Tax=Mycena sanguinolenta TaxID=230812 RepID=A0A8H6XEV9_9AGAR|nr:Aspartate aminotransferase [Mycena sanguinolenta]
MFATTFTRRTAGVGAGVLRSLSTWSAVPAGPPDPILGITEAFKADKDARKINLGVGAYRDGQGKPYVLDCAESILEAAQLDKEYLPITGLADFTKNAVKLAYGTDSAPLTAGSVRCSPSPGLVRSESALLSWLGTIPMPRSCISPNPSWGNHTPIFRDSGFEVRTYGYFNPTTLGLDFEALKADLLTKAPEHSVVLLHACAHNPTGVDPTPEQWAEISDICKERKLFPFFDMAYQGFASGSTSRDAFAVRHFVSQGHQVALCQSFAKNMGLYGERVGAFSLVTADPDEKARVDSQLKIIIRPINEELYAEWEREVKGMADRIISMREKLYNTLTNDLKTPGDWSHIKSQIGMFSFTGLKKDQTKALAEKAHIYMTADGRISMAGLNASNISYFAEGVDAAVKGTL